MKNAYKLTPSLHECIWGGERLTSYGKARTGGKLGESWELSFVPGSEALIDEKKINEVFGREKWGRACEKFENFPVLTKFIDAQDKLSVQVHPSDEYALLNEGQYGKTEMWYVIDAEEGAGIYMGLNKDCTPEEFSRAVLDGSVEKLLSFCEVKAGDVYFIPSGTIHAIGKGVLIFEIQQNSTLTYRLYDYMRRDGEGNLRELHIEKAMKVASLGKYEPFVSENDDSALIGKCEYFAARRYTLTKEGLTLEPKDSFISVTCTRGSGTIDGEEFFAGDSFFIPSDGGRVEIFGDCDIITVSVE